MNMEKMKLEANPYESLVLWQKICHHAKNMDATIFSEEIEFFVVRDNQEDEEEFGESMADDYGFQDYGYKVKYEKIGKFTRAELQKLMETLEDSPQFKYTKEQEEEMVRKGEQERTRRIEICQRCGNIESSLKGEELKDIVEQGGGQIGNIFYEVISLSVCDSCVDSPTYWEEN